MPVVYYLEPADQGQPCQHPTHAETGRGTAVVSHDNVLYCPRDLEQTTRYLPRAWDYQELRKPGRDARFQDKGVVRGPLGTLFPTDLATYDQPVPIPWSEVRANDFSPPRTYDIVVGYESTDGPPLVLGFVTARFQGTDLRGAGVIEALTALNADLVTYVFGLGGRSYTQLVTWREVT